MSADIVTEYDSVSVLQTFDVFFGFVYLFAIHKHQSV